MFGSTLAGRFVLDSVFVVGSTACTWTALENPGVGGQAFAECTVRSVAFGERHAESCFTLYVGAIPQQPVGRMFSWVPCAPRFGASWPRFARPTIELPGVINPASRRSPRGATEERTLDQIHQLWTAVADQVEAQGLHLGSRLRTPPRLPPSRVEWT